VPANKTSATSEAKSFLLRGPARLPPVPRGCPKKYPISTKGLSASYIPWAAPADRVLAKGPAVPSDEFATRGYGLPVLTFSYTSQEELEDKISKHIREQSEILTANDLASELQCYARLFVGLGGICKPL
jgi:hypothetical protein